MNFKVLLITMLIVVVISEVSCKERRSRKKKQTLETAMDNETGTKDSGDNVAMTSMCHKVALRRCGQSFMKIFNLVDYLDGMDHYNAQCALRKAFFACLEKVRQKPCRRRHIGLNYDEKKFTDKLGDAIWATRVCVLGIQHVDEIPNARSTWRDTAPSMTTVAEQKQ